MKTLRVHTYVRMPGWVSQTAHLAAAQWRRMSPREKRLAGLVSAFAMTVLIWLIALQPALQTIQRLNTLLPKLRADAAQLDAVIQEAKQLGARPSRRALPVAEVPQALRGGLELAGLGQTATITVAGADEWQVSFERAPVQEVLAWLQDLPIALRMQPTGVSLHRPVDDRGRMLSGVLSGAIAVTRPAGSQP